MRYLLDTNIISNLVKPQPASSLVDWMKERRDDELFICSLTLAELARGILQMPAGRKRDELHLWFIGDEGPAAIFDGRILPFDQASAVIWAQLMADGKMAGRPRSALDRSSPRLHTHMIAPS